MGSKSRHQVLGHCSRTKLTDSTWSRNVDFLCLLFLLLLLLLKHSEPLSIPPFPSSNNDPLKVIPMRKRVRILMTASSLLSSNDDKNNMLEIPSTESLNITPLSLCLDSKHSVQNFRPVAGIPKETICRCASTDVLGAKLKVLDATKQLQSNSSLTSHLFESCCSSADVTILSQAGMIIDLRSAVERDESNAQFWMNHDVVKATTAPFIRVVEDENLPQPLDHLFSLHSPSTTRFVIRLDVLNPSLFMRYCDDNWLATQNKAQLVWYKTFSGQKLHEWRMDELNRRGLAGLNEAILETGKESLCVALQLITLYREALLRMQPCCEDKKVIIHCVQGKDRTGMLAMLLQSLLEVSDDEIIEDYFQSNAHFPTKSTAAASSAAATASSRASSTAKGKLDRTIFSGTNRQAMTTTLTYLRSKYGSIIPGYLDDIGFDEQWRSRLRTVLVTTTQTYENNLDTTIASNNTVSPPSVIPNSRL
ncbi:protein tyrosine/serine phosphatase [Nitzschia inconspicua]|uniref:Protein tyrosine/serine phosphatase n=1 Tax=Nitzschia inconspicua TaxID=303405 RepID=A0A9K3PDQ9_9STRA|nr:protein tyrosine/serine phosphatase [Nitzschia inconspicua]